MITYEKYVIEPNECGGWVLRDKKVAKEGKNAGQIQLFTLCYPSTIKGCINRILEYKFKEVVAEKDYPLNEALKELERLNLELTNFLKENVKEEIL